jgi:hypothetical protein
MFKWLFTVLKLASSSALFYLPEIPNKEELIFLHKKKSRIGSSAAAMLECQMGVKSSTLDKNVSVEQHIRGSIYPMP